MNQREIDVVCSAGTKLFAIGFIILAEMLFISLSVWGGDGINGYGGICAVLYAIGGIGVLYTMYMFKFSVRGHEIYGRKRTGKKYRFDISEITKIYCEKGGGGDCTPYCDIWLEVHGKNIILKHTMKGFGQFASYIIEMYEANELENCKISKTSLTLLKKVRRGKIKAN